jgi:WD40 repeat protein
MNFSNPIKYSGLASFSPDGKYFYITKINELLVFYIFIKIYETENSTLPTKFQFQDFISHAQWSPDSEYILVGLFKKGICEARSIKGEDNWSCKIDEVLF